MRAILLFWFVSANVPAQENSWPHADGRFYYHLIGRGEPLLLLAGGPGFPGDYLKPVAEVLQDSFLCIIPDQRGTGRSQLNRIDSTTVNLDVAVADLEDLRKHLNLETWNVLGHSWGGMLAMAYAATFPKHVNRLALIGSGGIDLDFYNGFSANLESRLPKRQRRELTSWDPSKKDRDALSRYMKTILPAYFFDPDASSAMAPFFTADRLNDKISDWMLADLYRRGYDLTLAIRRYSGPVLILQGRQDIIGESTAHRIHQAVLQSQLQFIESCGHFPWIEKPAEFKTAVRRFLMDPIRPFAGMRQYFFVMLKRGPNRSQDSTTAAALQAGHMANISRMYQDGKLAIAGPFGDDGEWRGIFIIDAASIDEVKSLLAKDPAIEAGRLVYEIHPWWGAKRSRLP